MQLWALKSQEFPIPNSEEALKILKEINRNIDESQKKELNKIRARSDIEYDPSKDVHVSLHRELGAAKSRQVHERADWFIEMNIASKMGQNETAREYYD